MSTGSVVTPPVFIDLSLDDQLRELRSYFVRLKGDIGLLQSPKGLEEDLREVVKVVQVCFNEDPQEVEPVLNAIVSVLVLIPPERGEPLLKEFVSKVDDKRLGEVALRVLWLLFQALHKKSILRYCVYVQIVRVAKRLCQVSAIYHGLGWVHQELPSCNLQQWQNLLRLLHESLEVDQAREVMMALLGTFNDETAGSASGDARRCVLAAVRDPKEFMLEPLLSLKPVRCLTGEKIHSLLEIMVHGDLSEYLQFVRKVGEVAGVQHEAAVAKMRYLTFLSLAEDKTEVDFDTMRLNLRLSEEKVEEFMVDLLKTGLVRGRMDQVARKVYITSAMRRTFGRQEWSDLYRALNTWKALLGNVLDTLISVTQ